MQSNTFCQTHMVPIKVLFPHGFNLQLPQFSFCASTVIQSICRKENHRMKIFIINSFKKETCWGAWVAQSVERLPSALVMIPGSGHDPRVQGWSPTSGSLLSGEPASPPSATFPPCTLLLSLKKIKSLKKKQKIYQSLNTDYMSLGRFICQLIICNILTHFINVNILF